jgi:hypothetical protein
MCPLTQQYAYELNVKKIKLIIPFQCKLTLPQLVKLKTLFLPEKKSPCFNLFHSTVDSRRTRLMLTNHETTYHSRQGKSVSFL